VIIFGVPDFPFLDNFHIDLMHRRVVGCCCWLDCCVKGICVVKTALMKVLVKILGKFRCFACICNPWFV